MSERTEEVIRRIEEQRMKSWNRGFEDGKAVYRRQWTDHVFPFLWGLFIGFIMSVLLTGCAHKPPKVPINPSHRTTSSPQPKYARTHETPPLSLPNSVPERLRPPDVRLSHSDPERTHAR